MRQHIGAPASGVWASRILARIGIAALATAALAGCGQRAELKPKVGHALPPPAFGRTERPDARQLLAVSPEQRPVNSVELRIKSEPRGDDPFDLPPR